MAFKEKLDKNSGEFFSFKEHGDQLTGFYLGTFDHEGEWGPTKKHLFQNSEDGTMMSVIGQAQLTSLLTDESDPVVVGSLVQVTYWDDRKGRKGNPTKIYKVAVDDEQRLDQADVEKYAEAANEPASYDDSEPVEVEEEETPMDEVKTAPARKIAAPVKTITPEAKKRATDILNRRKTA